MNTNDFKLFCDKAKKISGKCLLPICDYALIKDGEITVTNLDITITQKIDGLQDFGTGLIDIKDLSKIVDKLKNTDINISFSSEIEVYESHNNGVKKERKIFNLAITSPKGNFKFGSYAPEDFPKSVECDQEFDQLYVSDIELIKKTVKYVGTKSFDIITYQHVWIDKDSIVGTDASLMAYYKRDQPHENKFSIHFSVVNLLDLVSYEVMCKKELKGQVEEITNYTLLDPENDIRYTFRNKMEKAIPMWDAVIPQTTSISSKLTIKHDILKELLDVCQLSMNSGSQLLIFENDPEMGIFTLSCSDQDRRQSFSRTLSVVNSGENIKIGFKHGYLVNLMNTEKDKEYTFNFVDPSRCSMINEKLLLFPMMLTNP